MCVCVCVSVRVFTCTCQADGLSEKHRASWTCTTLWLSARFPSSSQPTHYHFGSFLLLPVSTHCFALIHCIAHAMNSMLMNLDGTKAYYHRHTNSAVTALPLSILHLNSCYSHLHILNIKLLYVIS